MNPTELAKMYLRTWYDAAQPSMTFSEFINYTQEATGTFLQNFGNACIAAEKSIGKDSLHSKMRDLGKLSNGKVSQFPDGSFRGQEFFDVLYRGVQSWDLKRIGSTALEITASGAEKIASVGGMVLSTYVILGALGFAFAIYSMTKSRSHA